MKALIQYKSGEQVVGDTRALISNFPDSEIEHKIELSNEEHEVLTNPEEKASMEIEDK